MRLRFLMVYLSIKSSLLEPGNILSGFESKINFKIKNRSRIYNAMFRLWKVSIFGIKKSEISFYNQHALTSSIFWSVKLILPSKTKILS